MIISRFSIIPECNLLIEYYAGKVSLSHFLELKKQEALHPYYSPSLSVITDIRNVDYHVFEKQYLEQFVNFIKQNNTYNAKRKTIIITQTPNQVVWAQLFDEFIREIGVFVRTVTSPKSAYAWLHIPLEHVSLVEDEMKKLSDNISNFYIPNSAKIICDNVLKISNYEYV